MSAVHLCSQPHITTRCAIHAQVVARQKITYQTWTQPVLHALQRGPLFQAHTLTQVLPSVQASNKQACMPASQTRAELSWPKEIGAPPQHMSEGKRNNCEYFVRDVNRSMVKYRKVLEVYTFVYLLPDVHSSCSTSTGVWHDACLSWTPYRW